MNQTQFSNSLSSQGSLQQTSIQHTQPMSMSIHQQMFQHPIAYSQQTDIQYSNLVQPMSMQSLPSYQLPVQAGYISTSSAASPYSGQGRDVISASQIIHPFNQQHGGNFVYNTQPMFLTNQTNSSTTLLNQNHLSNNFFYQPLDDLFNYHIKCEKISLQLLNNNNSMQLKEDEHTFYYQQQSNNQLYQISCKIVSPNYLNEIFFGMEIVGQKKYAFTSDQKANLQFYLTQYLSLHLLN